MCPVTVTCAGPLTPVDRPSFTELAFVVVLGYNVRVDVGDYFANVQRENRPENYIFTVEML